MTQATFDIDPTQTTGTQLAQLLNDFKDAVHSTHLGSSEPVYKTEGLLWIDDSSSGNYVFKLYNGSAWLTILTVTGAGVITMTLEYSSLLNKPNLATVATSGNYNDLLNIPVVPAGKVDVFSSNVVPAGYLECNGSEISRTTYSDLFTAIGTTYGAGDGTTTFNIIDLRGEFIRGWDNGRGIDVGRTLGSFQLDDFKSHDHNVYPHAGHLGGSNNSGAGGGDIVSTVESGKTSDTGGAETRPRNIALMYCIKY